MRQCCICVADANEQAARALCDNLTARNYHAKAVQSGYELVEFCRGNDVDLLLLNVDLPDMSGYEALEKLRNEPLTHDVTVIFVTEPGAKEDISKGYSMGAVDYISKPYNVPILMIRLESALRERFLYHLPCQLSDSNGVDSLTGLRTRQYVIERLQEEVDKAHRYNFPVSCVVMDVDDVEPVDNELGPVSLDDLLVEIAMAIRSYSRTYDVLARYDGSLFAAVLPHAPLADAESYAKKIMDEVHSTTFSDPNFPTQTQLSAGVVTCSNGAAQGADLVFGEAMRALLRAKSRPHPRLVSKELP